ncbi:MAG: metallophosphoesterase [Polyangia bacterium]|jgi:3',5'-cyclic AMP phosphodiesterase CpdA
MFRLAHVTDLHVRNFAGARVRDFFGKRAIGSLNLALVRRRKHRMELLAALGEDLRARPHDHLVVSGDLGNVSLLSEWRAARNWIERTGSSIDNTTVIPGNHDTYVKEVVVSGAFEQLFAAYQRADVRLAADRYPFARLRGEIAIVCANTCVPTGDLGAWGRLGEAQLQRVEALLAAPEVRERFRVLVIHHPPVMHRPPENRNLRDRAKLAEVLGRVGAELVLHGHDHRDEFADLPGPDGRRIPVVGAGSASYAGATDKWSRYNIYEIDGARVDAFTYAHDSATGAFREVRRRTVAG